MLRAATLFLLAALPAVAQDAPTYTLRGTVVDAATGHPIARARVASQDQRLATLTGSDGRFSLPVTPLDPAGELSLDLNANRPGYLGQTARVAHLGPATPELTLRLTPTASLSGHLSAPGLDSAPNVPVRLYSRVPDGTGYMTWRSSAETRTDSHGDYRFLDLTPGTYTVGTAPWYPENLYPPRTGPAQQYPATFNGATPDVESALKLSLSAGQFTRADLQLHLATYYPVHVPLAAKGNTTQSIHLELAGTDTSTGLPFTYLPSTNFYECWLQPGAHTLTLLSQQGSTAWGQLEVNVPNAPLRTAPVTLTPLSPIPVHINKQFSHPEVKSKQEQELGERHVLPDSSLYIVLTSTLATSQRYSQSGHSFLTKEKDQFLVTPTHPGTYQVMAGALHGYVAALSSGSTDLLRRPLTVTTSPQPIEVTLRDDGATLNATIDFGTTPIPHAATVLLVPTDGSTNLEGGFSTDGAVATCKNIPPGTYRAFAVPAPFFNLVLPWHEPGVLAAIEAKALTITVVPNQHLTLTVPLILDFPQLPPSPELTVD